MKNKISEIELFNQLREFLAYGYSVISKVELKHNTRPKKIVLFAMMCACQSYSEAILKLNHPPGIYDKAAEVLMRSLVENFVNMNFIYASSNQQNAVTFLVHSLYEKVDFAEKYKAFMIKYPDWKIPFGKIMNASDWDDFIYRQKREINEIQKHYKNLNVTQLSSLRNLAIEVDIANIRKGKKLTTKNSLELYYILYYKYFSQIAHLTMPGLERFFKINNNGQTKIEVDGHLEDTVGINAIIYQIYFVTFKHYSKEFKINDPSGIQPFKDFSKRLLRK